MTQIVLDLPPEIRDALEHLAGRNEVAIANIINDAVRKDLRQRSAVYAQRMHRSSQSAAA